MLAAAADNSDGLADLSSGRIILTIAGVATALQRRAVEGQWQVSGRSRWADSHGMIYWGRSRDTSECDDNH
jgi:hypothetical protein